MTFSKLIPLFCALLINQAVAQVPDIGPVSEVGVGRVGDNVVRYIKVFGSGCLNVQVINPEKKWEVLSFSSFCEFEGKSFDSDFADASSEDISVEADGIHFVLSLTPLQPAGEQRRHCVIPVDATVIRDLSCSDNDD